MQYLIQIYSNDSMFRYDGLSEEEKEAVMGEYFAISGAPGVTGGAQLQPPTTATTVRVEDGHFFQWRNLVPQKALREHPALVRMEGLRADERHLAALVVFANAFAGAAAANAAPDDEIIALNHVQADDRKSVRPLAREKLASLSSSYRAPARLPISLLARLRRA